MTSPDLRIARPRTLADEVARALVQLVRRGEWPAGTKLPSEKVLAERFAVSRTVVREAISRLKSDGLVASLQGKGAFVRAAGADVPFRLERDVADTVRSVLLVVELRRGVEAEAAALAATRRTAAELRDIQRALRALAQPHDDSDFGLTVDQDFHRAIARATENPHYLGLWDYLGQFLTPAMRITRAYEARHPELVAEVQREHEALAGAIARQDPEAARAAARHHLERVAARITAAEPDFWEAAGGAAGRKRAARRGTRGGG